MKLLNLFKASEEKQLARTQFEAARAEFTKEELRAAGIGPVQSLLSYFRSSLSSSVHANGSVDVTELREKTVSTGPAASTSQNTEAGTDNTEITQEILLTSIFSDSEFSNLEPTSQIANKMFSSTVKADKPGFFGKIGSWMKSFSQRTWKPALGIATASILLLTGKDIKVGEGSTAQATTAKLDINKNSELDQKTPRTDAHSQNQDKIKKEQSPSYQSTYATGVTNGTGMTAQNHGQAVSLFGNEDVTNVAFTLEEYSDKLIELKDELNELDESRDCAETKPPKKVALKNPAKQKAKRRQVVKTHKEPAVITVTYATGLNGLDSSVQTLEPVITQQPPASPRDVASVCRAEIASALYGKELLPATDGGVRQIIDPTASTPPNAKRVATTARTYANGPNPDALYIKFTSTGGVCSKDVTSTNEFPDKFRSLNSLIPSDDSVTVITDSTKAVRLDGSNSTNNLAPEAK